MTSMLPEQGEYLTTGWEDDLDPADSVFRQAVLAHVSWARALTSAARGTFTRGDGWCAGSGGGASALLNLAIVTSPPQDWARDRGRHLRGIPRGCLGHPAQPLPHP